MKPFKMLCIFLLLSSICIGLLYLRHNYYVVTYKTYQKLDFIGYDILLIDKNTHANDSFITLNHLIRKRLKEITIGYKKGLKDGSYTIEKPDSIYQICIKGIIYKTTYLTLKRVYEFQIFDYIYHLRGLKSIDAEYVNENEIDGLKDVFWQYLEKDRLSEVK